MKNKFNIGDKVIGYDFNNIANIWVDVIEKITITSYGWRYYVVSSHGGDFKNIFRGEELRPFSRENLDLIAEKYEKYCYAEYQTKVKDTFYHIDAAVMKELEVEQETNN